MEECGFEDRMLLGWQPGAVTRVSAPRKIDGGRAEKGKGKVVKGQAREGEGREGEGSQSLRTHEKGLSRSAGQRGVATEEHGSGVLMIPVKLGG